ncbi:MULTISPECIES: phage terminase small subunit-related protein [Lysinibacillus]|uniref:Phage terminase small subunit-related protein n=1 Tax=Lysinibacillus irui TaxID=2998077 RepID=A0AAJ5UT68_9BACI|nr:MULTISPECIES: phage terminase small subunit-related protein [Lysinibacillus]WDV05067.1 phage terminase small subunit-related protein [Lysinibacillus irui]
MARPRNPKCYKAFQMWLESKGQMLLKDIAEQLELLDSQIRKWKNQDKWDVHMKGNVTKRNNAKSHGTPSKIRKG